MKKKILVSIFLAVSAFIFIVIFFDPFINDKVTKEGPSRYVTRYILGNKATHIEVGPEGLYNGKQISWHLFSEQKRQEGIWKNGFWDGEWIYYNKDEQVESIILYKKGIAKKHYKIINGNKTEVPKEDWKYVVDQYKIGRIE